MEKTSYCVGMLFRIEKYIHRHTHKNMSCGVVPLSGKLIKLNKQNRPPVRTGQSLFSYAQVQTPSQIQGGSKTAAIPSEKPSQISCPSDLLIRKKHAQEEGKQNCTQCTSCTRMFDNFSADRLTLHKTRSPAERCRAPYTVHILVGRKLTKH